jgi:hypothetical protein
MCEYIVRKYVSEKNFVMMIGFSFILIYLLRSSRDERECCQDFIKNDVKTK